jgi:poly(A) polymerase
MFPDVRWTVSFVPRYCLSLMRLPELIDHAISYRFVGVSALEHFVRVPPGPLYTVETTADLVELAKMVDGVSFPGMPGWDAMFFHEGKRVLVRVVDSYVTSGNPFMRFTFDPVRRAFSDPHEIYPTLREIRTRQRQDGDHAPVPIGGLAPLEAAILTSRFAVVPETVTPWTADPAVPAISHRLVLEQILAGNYAWRGLEVLYRSGYIADVLPELVPMNRTDHSKEGHPEGNVWKHSLETLRYRKTPDFLVSLALLLHDAGKPYAEPEGGRRFHAHAEIGADLAYRLLQRLEFSREEIADVTWLIRNHMIPGALERLPDSRRDPIMESPLFPRLLEVYRCDLSSTYRGPEGYYRACHVYRRFLKRSRRSREERSVRRLVQLYVD